MSDPKKMKGERPETNEARAVPAADGPESAAPVVEDAKTYVDRLQRLQAEFENYKKRMAREAAAIEERVEDRTIQAFLDLYDNLERAFASYAAERDDAAFVSGIEQIFGQFSQLLEQLHVERVPAVGEPFDPALHEAVLSMESDKEKNTILEEFLPGYRRGDRVMRPSKVSVSQGPAPREEADE